MSVDLHQLSTMSSDYVRKQSSDSWTKHLARIAECRRRFPGPEYCEVLRWIHETIRPLNYVEIGVSGGRSLCLAGPATLSIGIDPNPQIIGGLPAKTRLFRLTSNEFFSQYDLPTLIDAPHFSLAFVDGLHLFEQALMDFINLEKWSGRGSLVLFHDTMPLDAKTSARKQETAFYTGDVWKLLLCLIHYRPDLRIVTIRTAPSGLSMISNLDSGSGVLRGQQDLIVKRLRGLSFTYFQRHKHEFLNEIGNTYDEVKAALGRLVGEDSLSIGT